MSIPSLILVIAVLMVVIALAEPLARRLLLPSSVVLAGIGIAVGLLASWLVFGGVVAPDEPFARFFADPPLPSAVFLTLFLPTLLFQSALGLNVAEMADDAVPILMLAVIAVVTATLAIGFALWPFAAVGLAACLLLGSIVATTDPVAVIGIFRAVGAPERLVRLVEGESLLNDAAAITMFVVFSALVVEPEAVSGAGVAADFLVVPLGGVLIGYVAGRAAAWLIGAVGDNSTIEISLSLALPYLVYVLSEQVHLSGVMAVVAAGLTLAREAPARMTPESWRALRDVWNQLDYWAATFLFLLASVLIPRLLAGASLADAGLLVVMVLAATAARGVIVYGVLPLLARVGWSTDVSGPYRAVIFWGGLRGATTLALALAVTENPAMPPEVTHMVAVLATGFTLYTLLVQGTTLRPLMKRLGLDRLTPLEESLRDEALAHARSRVAETLGEAVRRTGLTAPAVLAAVDDYRRPAAAPPDRPALTPEEKAAVALVALARREQELVLLHAGEGVFPPPLAGTLLAAARSMLDGARLRGPEGWAASAAAALGFDWRDRLASLLHRRFRAEGPLVRRLERRFAVLLANRILLGELDGFARDSVLPLAGDAAGAAVRAALDRRAGEVSRALEALHKQYPDYASAVEASFAREIGLALEEQEVRALAGNGLVNAEVERDLLRDIGERRAAAGARPRLDLGLDTTALVARTPLFAGLEPSRQAEIARALRPVFAYPGQRLIRRGDKGDEAFFISSGAVEVDTGRATFLLGRGDVIGEMALITGKRRSGDATAVAYSALLSLSKRDFDAFMASRPEVRQRLEELAAERERVNREPA